MITSVIQREVFVDDVTISVSLSMSKNSQISVNIVLVSNWFCFTILASAEVVFG